MAIADDFKRAQTFGFTYKATRAFAYDPDPDNWTVSSQIRLDNTAVNLTVSKSGAEGGFLGLYSFATDGTVGALASATATKEWALGRWRVDVRFEHVDGTVEYSPTVTVPVIERETRVA